MDDKLERMWEQSNHDLLKNKTNLGEIRGRMDSVEVNELTQDHVQ
jgi:hypothetical protein